jgi:hypothetical protein
LATLLSREHHQGSAELSRRREREAGERRGKERRLKRKSNLYKVKRRMRVRVRRREGQVPHWIRPG